MENESLKFDNKFLNLLCLYSYKKNPENINKDKDNLYKIVNDYLELNGANPMFLNKPAVVERIKRILFNNLLLGKNTKFTNNGSVVEEGEKYKQILSILKNGSIIFYREYYGKKRITYFDMMENDIVCRYLEYSDNEYLRSEKRIIIDEYGFDKEYYDLDYNLEKKYREVFNPIITSTDSTTILALVDNGDYTIAPYTDNFFLDRNLLENIQDDILDENLIEHITYTDMSESFTSYPKTFKIEDFENIYKIKKNFEYFKLKYPNSESWYINRYGKEFLIDNSIISKNNNIEECSILDRIELASENELFIYFQNKSLDYRECSTYIKYLYDKGLYFKSFIFLKKMNDSDLCRLLVENLNFSTEYISKIVTFLKSDQLKIQMLNCSEIPFDIESKITIIENLKDENSKVLYYSEYMDEIMEYDNYLLEYELEDYEDSELEYVETLSQRVLDSLSNHDNLYKYIILLKPFSKIKYEYIKDFSREEIEYILKISEEILDLEEYVQILKTDKIYDDEIIEFLESNWEDGLQISQNDEEISVNDDLKYTFKVFSLLKIKDEDKKNEFLEEHIEDYGADEITKVLEDFSDSKKMLSLAKKFELPKRYYYDLVILCEDEEKFKCLEEEPQMDEEDLSIIISSIYDMPKAFKYVENIENLNALQKLRILSKIEADLYDQPEVMKRIKIDFLIDNKDEIFDNIKSKDDIDTIYSYISDYDDNLNPQKVIEEFKERMIQIDEDLIE